MAFINTNIAALILLLSVSVSVVASSIAEVPASSPSSSPGPSGGVSKEEDGQYLLEKMKEMKSKLEEFMSKDMVEWENDPASNSKICVEKCKVQYNSALYCLNGAMRSVSAGDFNGVFFSNFDDGIKTCYVCFDEWTQIYKTVIYRPDSIEKFSRFIWNLTEPCSAKFAQYTT